MKSAEILLRTLQNDSRALRLLKPDRQMLISLNLGKLLESLDVDEKELGLSLCLFLLRHDEKIVICDILTNDQIIARDIISKR